MPIHEVGEHEGQQYFSMKFIDGSPLNESPRCTIKEEVERMLLIAKAVSFAHQRGILHRDLKPSNILIGNDGAPHVADFGLAKRMESRDRSLTETGQVIGTPRYMPPEQAAGAKTLTVAADVYALGAILYERLAGRPAFAGENTMAILDAVKNTPPTPIAALNPGIDRDLATLVHKALEKDATHRYATAGAFVADLQHWLNGEPIEARPVSRAERVRRWCKRNPALATAGGLAAAGLVVATIMSAAFALQWQRRAKADRDRVRVAKKAEEDAIVARDSIEKTFARSFIRPLDPNPTATSLSEPEIQALWELVELTDDRVRIRFLDESASDPVAVRQLRARLGIATNAAIGLDPERREKMVQVMVRRLRDPSLPLAQRVDLALVGLELEDQAGPFTEECVRVVASGLEDTDSAATRYEWEKSLFARVDRLDPSTIANLLIIGLDREMGTENTGFTAAIIECTKRMEKSRARATLLRTAQIVLDDLDPQPPKSHERIKDSRTVATLCNLAPKLDITDAIQILEKAFGVKELPWEQSDTIADVLMGLAKQSGVREAQYIHATLAKHYIQAIITDGSPDRQTSASNHLAKIAQQTNRTRSASLTRAMIENVTETAETAKDARTAGELAWAAAPMIELEGKGEAERICGAVSERLTRDMKVEKDWEVRSALVRGLSATVIRLNPNRAVNTARFLASTAKRFEATNDMCISDLYYLLTELDSTDAERVAKILAAAMKEEEDAETRWFLGAGFCLVAQNIKPEIASEICGLVVKELAEAVSSRSVNSWVLVDGYLNCVSCLNPIDAALVADIHANTIAQDSNADRRSDLMKLLLAATSRQTLTSSSRAYDVIEKHLIPSAYDGSRGFGGFKDSLDFIGDINTSNLAATISRMDLSDSIRLLHSIFDEESKLGESLAATTIITRTIASKPSEEARAAAGQIAKVLLQDLQSRVGPPLVEPAQLEVATSAMGADEAATLLLGALEASKVEASDILTEAALRALARPSAVSAPGARSERVAMVLSQYLQSRTKNSLVNISVIKAASSGMPLDRLLDLLAESLRGEKTAEIRDSIADAFLNTSEESNLPRFAKLRREIIVDRWRAKQDWPFLGEKILPELTKERAHAIARDTCAVIGQGSNINEKDRLGLLRLFLADVSMPKTVDQATKLVLASIGLAKLESPPCRLTTQELVELLKMPTVFGEARVVVLDHLGNRYHRKFANHWQFVRYAKDHHLNLDFTTPPKRPDPKGLADRILAILDAPDAK